MMQLHVFSSLFGCLALSVVVAGCGAQDNEGAAHGEHGAEGHIEAAGSEDHGGEGESEHDDVVTLSPEAMAASEIVVGKAARRALGGGVVFPGELAFEPSATAHVSSLGAGRFAEVSATLGARVEVGQVLATVVSTDVADLDGLLAQANARLKGAEAELRRATVLLKEGVGPERGVVEARSLVATLRAEIAGIDKRRAVYGPAAAGLVALRSPVAGVVVETHAVVGESALGDQPAFVVTDPTRLYVEVYVPELDITRVSVGAAVVVRPNALPDTAFEGRVATIAPGLDARTRTLPVRVTLDQVDPRLRGHMFVSVELVNGAVRPVTVPADGVAVFEGRDVVFVPGEAPGTFVPHVVRLGRRADGFVEVVEGLDEGADVVLHGAFVLKSALAAGELSSGHAH